MSVLDEPGVKEKLTIAANQLMQMHNDEEAEMTQFDLGELDGDLDGLRNVINNMEVMKFINGILEDNGLIMGQNADNELEICVMTLECYQEHIQVFKTSVADYSQLVEQFGDKEAQKIIVERHKIATGESRLN